MSDYRDSAGYPVKQPADQPRADSTAREIAERLTWERYGDLITDFMRDNWALLGIDGEKYATPQNRPSVASVLTHLIAAALADAEARVRQEPTIDSAFNVGDPVTWTSQAQGSTRTKVGTIAEIVPAGQRPDRKRFLRLYTGPGVGYSRKNVSYVVLVGNKPYWPIADKLKPAVAQPDPVSVLSARLAAVEQALRDIQRITETPAFLGVFTIAEIHGCGYRGEQFPDIKKLLSAALGDPQ